MEKNENRVEGEKKLECKVISHMRYRTDRRLGDTSTESSSPNFPITSQGKRLYSSTLIGRHPNKNE